MRIAAIQHDIAWEDGAATRRHLEPLVAGATGSGAGLVVLTEMFATGFSLEAERIAEAGGRADLDVDARAGRDARRVDLRLGGRAAVADRTASKRGGTRRAGRDGPPLRQAPPVHLRR